MDKRHIKRLILFTLFISFIGINVYAATTSKLHFCEYRGTLRMMKIIGMFIIVAKTVVPIIIMYKAIKELVQVVIGKPDSLKETVPKLAKSTIAALAIFFVPTIVNYAVNLASDGKEDSDMAKCSTCLFNVRGCKIPEEDPEVTTRD